MPFVRNTLSQIISRIVSDFQTRITGATSLLRRSTLSVIARINAGQFHLLYEYLDYQARQLFVTTADEAGLEAHSSEYGITRKAAVAATGSGVTGTSTNGIVIPAGTELQSPNEQLYTTDADVTVAAGIATLAFTASVAGTDGNDDPGIVLSFVSPIAGVSTSVTVDADGIIEGTDEEIDTALRERVLTRKRQPPHGGADFDYETWALENSGVTRAWSFPLYQGLGTIGLAFVRDDDTDIIPSAAEMATVRAYIVEHEDPGTGKTVGCPVTAEPGLYMITLTPLVVNFSIDIYPNTAAVQASVQANIEDIIMQDGGPGETLFLSRIAEAISLADGEVRHRIDAPIVDTTASNTQIHQLGTITFGNY
jgi:uncharacterized phage protein gp47/JayE